MLTRAEIRVLGCLVEKQLATPNAYPLTEAAVLTACNQATNRDPVMTYDTAVVRRALIGLRQHGLAREVHRPGERAAKHRHLLDEALELSVPESAVLTVLALRGPQTAAELRARTERLHGFASVAEVESVLERLAAHPAGALAQLQERRPGQKEARWTHLLLAADADADPHGDAGGPAAAAVGGAEDRTTAAPRISLIELSADLATLREEVTALREEVRTLRESLRALRADPTG